jgi:hypothetical protein
MAGFLAETAGVRTSWCGALADYKGSARQDHRHEPSRPRKSDILGDEEQVGFDVLPRQLLVQPGDNLIVVHIDDKELGVNS